MKPLRTSGCILFYLGFSVWKGLNGVGCHYFYIFIWSYIWLLSFHFRYIHWSGLVWHIKSQWNTSKFVVVMWLNVDKFKGGECFCKALYDVTLLNESHMHPDSMTLPHHDISISCRGQSGLSLMVIPSICGLCSQTGRGMDGQNDGQADGPPCWLIHRAGDSGRMSVLWWK